jgi:Asp-tRNA(Asn)/Glu-tRNA(Gln) amidotransferase A subunit family amidase
MAQRQKARAALLDELKDVDACIMTGGTNIMHFTGLPSIALPMCMGTDGAPLGVVLYGADQRRLLAAAQVIERYCPGVPAPCLTAKNGV